VSFSMCSFPLSPLKLLRSVACQITQCLNFLNLRLFLCENNQMWYSWKRIILSAHLYAWFLMHRRIPLFRSHSRTLFASTACWTALRWCWCFATMVFSCSSIKSLIVLKTELNTFQSSKTNQLRTSGTTRMEILGRVQFFYEPTMRIDINVLPSSTIPSREKCKVI